MERLSFANKKIMYIFAGLFALGIVTCMIPVSVIKLHHIPAFSYITMILISGRSILKNPYDNTPVFYEANDKGQKIPVRIKFYTFGRWLSILFNGIITVTLPLLIAAFLRWGSMEEGESFMEGFHPMYGAAWYTLTVFVVILYFVKGVRKDAYDHPIIYQLYSNGKTKLIGKRRDRKLSVLSMFGVARTERD